MKKTILIFTLIVAVILCACGEKEIETITLEGVYNGTAIEIAGLDDGERFVNFREMFYLDGKVQLLGTVMDETSSETAILSYDTKTEKWEKLALPYDGSIRSVALSDDGYLFISSTYDMESFRETYTIVAADADSVLWEKPLDEFLELPEQFWGSVYAVGGGDDWYIAAADTVVKLNGDGKILSSEILSGEVRGMFHAEDGIHVYGWEFHSILSATDGVIRDDAAWLKAMENVNGGISVGGGYDLLKSNENGLYGVNVAEGTSELLINWVNSGIAEAPGSLAMVSEDVIFVYRSDISASLAGETGLWKYEKCPVDELPEREIIRITYSETGRGKIPLAAVQFNKSQAKYHVVCEEYSAGGGDVFTMAEGIGTMLLDGTIGDIVEFDTINELEKHGTKGYLADLNTFMGDHIAADDIFGCVRTACETDGKLYGIPQEFKLWTCTVKDGALDDYPAWNVDAFADCYQKLTSEGRYIISNTSRAAIDTYLRDGMMQSFIDFDNATCNFDSDEFRNLITFLASLPEENTCELEYWNENHYITDEIFLYEALIGSYSDWGHLMAIYQGEGYDAVGYPSVEGGVVNLDAEKYYAITDGSDVKEGAMEFLAYFLSDECAIDEMRGMRCIPSLKSTMEVWNESEGQMYYYYYFGDIGRVSGNTKPFDESKQDPGMQVFAGDPVIVDGLYEFLDTAKIAKPIPDACAALITEELQAFYAGDKTADETAKLLQNRVGTYLAENQ